MNPNLRLFDYPIGAGMTRGARRWDQISTLVNKLPKSVRDMLASPQSASFIRGLTKAYKLSQEQGQTIAYAVLQVALGEKTVAQLSSVLSTEIPLPNDKAQKIAKEIEGDLFVPIMPELIKYLERKKSGVETASEKTISSSASLGVKNVLNLKDQKKAPPPPPMPGK
jgi:hypothetical protein